MYQTVNGIPSPIQKSLEKLDYNKIREAQAKDPVCQMIAKGMTQKEALIAYLNK